jgi:hypothetical protein
MLSITLANFNFSWPKSPCPGDGPNIHRRFFVSFNRRRSGINRQFGMISNPFLQSRLAQSGCPLRLRTNTLPHSTQTADIGSPRWCFSASIVVSQKRRLRSGGVNDCWRTASSKWPPCLPTTKGNHSEGFASFTSGCYIALGLVFRSQSFGISCHAGSLSPKAAFPTDDHHRQRSYLAASNARSSTSRAEERFQVFSFTAHARKSSLLRSACSNVRYYPVSNRKADVPGCPLLLQEQTSFASR